MADDLTLVIGDKNKSSWSLRPWLVMREFTIPFKEHRIFLDRPDSGRNIARHSPSGRVPCLLVGDFPIWDSLAIVEYLAERYPEKTLWPENTLARARARSITAEMHAGFEALRAEWPMAFWETRETPASEVVKADIVRIDALWADARDRFGAGGPFLFGRFSIADAFFAPVVSRFRTYGAGGLTDVSKSYMDALWGLDGMKEWEQGAQAEIA